jgi:transposase
MMSSCVSPEARMDRKFRKQDSRTGRPSVAPEQLLRALLLQNLYSIRNERIQRRLENRFQRPLYPTATSLSQNP